MDDDQQQQFNKDIEHCKRLTHEKHYAEALEVALKLLEQDGDNMNLHRLLATLYGISGKYAEAGVHYLMLVQFDPTFLYRHCIELVNGYHAKGITNIAALLAHAGAVKLESKELYELAVDYYQKSGNAETAEEIRQQLARMEDQ